jgi:tetratricopeptide (TPR) repeat protein
LSSCTTFTSVDEKVASLREDAARAVQNKDEDKASKSYEEAIKESRGSSTHLQTPKLMEEYSEYLMTIGKYPRAEQFLHEALSLLSKLTSEPNAGADRDAIRMDNLRCDADLARALKEQGKLQEAEPLYKEAIDLCTVASSTYVSRPQLVKEYEELLNKLGKSDAINQFDVKEGGQLAREAWGERFLKAARKLFSYAQQDGSIPAPELGREIEKTGLQLADRAKPFGFQDPSCANALTLAGMGEFVIPEKDKALKTLTQAAGKFESLPEKLRSKSQMAARCYYYIASIAHDKGNYHAAAVYASKARECAKNRISSFSEDLDWSALIYHADLILSDALNHLGETSNAKNIEKESKEIASLYDNLGKKPVQQWSNILR